MIFGAQTDSSLSIDLGIDLVASLTEVCRNAFKIRLVCELAGLKSLTL